MWRRLPVHRLPVRQIAGVAPVPVLALLLFRHWPMLDSGTDQLGSADWEWLLLAGVATVLAWACAATALHGSVLQALPAGRLLATQFAASAANHILPAGVGGNAVNLRFLIRCGLTPTRSAAALTVRGMASAVVRVALLLALFAAFPHALDMGRVTPGRPPGVLALAAALAVVGALVALLTVGRVRRALTGFVTTVAADIRALHCRAARATALWAGSLAFPLAQAAGLVAVVRALHAPVPAMHVAAAYLAASMVAALLPTPGGFGSLDVALGLALVTAGTTAVMATSAVLAFRILTVWLPLVPGVLVLAALVRRRVL